MSNRLTHLLTALRNRGANIALLTLTALMAILAPKPATAQTTPTFGTATVPDTTYTVNVAVSDTLPVAVAGVLTYTLTPALPAGLTYKAATSGNGGIIAGVPTAAASATTYTLTATDANNATATLTFTIAVTDIVNIPDNRLRAVIEDILGKARNAAITQAEMSRLTRLDAPNKGITDLTGLEFATDLDTLNLSNNSITALVSLGRLTRLTWLNLADNRLTDISPLRSLLIRLTWLNLADNRLTDISPLRSLIHLTWLNLADNRLTDISPLRSPLTSLTWLNLADNRLTDISPLRSLTRLTSLSLSGNRLADISSLRSLTRLTSLSLSGNRLADISPLQSLTRLTSIRLPNNRISDLSPLVSNSGLGYGDGVYVRGNPLSALSRGTHISTLTGRRVAVWFDTLSVARLVKVLGDGQTGTTSEALVNPFVVKVQSANDTTHAYRHLPVTFFVAAGGGSLSATSDTTDSNGLARTLLTLGATVGMDTVKAFVEGVSDTLIFSTVPIRSVTITDANLRAVIEDILGKARDASITNAEMLRLTRLIAPHKGISNLAGLEFATNLDTLDLGHDHRRGYPRINSNNITDIRALSGLTRLKFLSLERNAISDLSPLRNLTSLKSLDLRVNRISDISVLSHLTDLTELWFAHNSISDISSLSRLTDLTVLYLRNTGITNISALRGLTKLTNLNLYGNRVSDISALRDLTSLIVLNLYINGLTDISALRGLTSLTNLYLGENNISNLSILSHLTSLTTLNLWSNDTRISDLSPLSGLTNLTNLNLGGYSNKISDISRLSGLTKLKTLNLAWNNIINISSLSGLDSLKTLHLDHNRISDIEPLVLNTGLGSGDRVDVRGNPLSALSRGTHIPTLTGTGVTVSFDDLSIARLVKISGDEQTGTARDTLAHPFVVKVQSANNTTYAYRNLPVTFSVSAGGGSLSATSDTTDVNGLARTLLTLGATVGMDTVKAFVEGVGDTLIFSTVPIRSVTTPDDSDQMPTFGDTTIAAQSYLVNQSIASLTLPQASGGGESLVYILLPFLPDGLSFDPETRVLSGTPLEALTETTYTLSALDADGDLASLSFTLAVQTPSPDIDGDGTVTFADFLTFAGKFGSRFGQDRYDARCDLDGDGQIEFDDFLIFANSFGATG